MAVRMTGAGMMILAMLGGCGDGASAPAGNAAAPVVTIRNDYQDRMLRLDDLQRGAALRRAIRATGARCDRVEASAFQQDHANLKMWTARCQSNHYAVFLAPDGGVQVRPCADAKQLGLPPCAPLPEAKSAGKSG